MLTNVPLAVTITLSDPASTALSVPWLTRNGTAIAGTHFVAGSGTVNFAAGQSSATVLVYLKPLTASAPGALYFMVAVTAGTGYTIKASTGVVTINYG
jgi:chitinase